MAHFTHDHGDDPEHRLHESGSQGNAVGYGMDLSGHHQAPPFAPRGGYVAHRQPYGAPSFDPSHAYPQSFDMPTSQLPPWAGPQAHQHGGPPRMPVGQTPFTESDSVPPHHAGGGYHVPNTYPRAPSAASLIVEKPPEEVYHQDGIRFLREPSFRQAPHSDGPGVAASVPVAAGDLWKFAWFHHSFWDAIMEKAPEPLGMRWREPVLKRYFQFSFVRLLEQLRVLVDAVNDPPQWAAINTGLVTPAGDFLYVLFTMNVDRRVPMSAKPPTSNLVPPFMATGASVRLATDPAWDAVRNMLPPPPEYFSPQDLASLHNFRSDLHVNVGTWHVANSYARFVKAGLAPVCPPGEELADDVLRKLVDEVADAVRLVCHRSRVDSSLALPQFYYSKTTTNGVQVFVGRLQLLLPLYFRSTTTDFPSLALAVSRKPRKAGQGYEFHSSTLLTLDMAYSNFRLVQRRAWTWLTVSQLPNPAAAQRALSPGFGSEPAGGDVPPPSNAADDDAPPVDSAATTCEAATTPRANGDEPSDEGNPEAPPSASDGAASTTPRSSSSSPAAAAAAASASPAAAPYEQPVWLPKDLLDADSDNGEATEHNDSGSEGHGNATTNSSGGAASRGSSSLLSTGGLDASAGPFSAVVGGGLTWLREGASGSVTGGGAALITRPPGLGSSSVSMSASAGTPAPVAASAPTVPSVVTSMPRPMPTMAPPASSSSSGAMQRSPTAAFGRMARAQPQTGGMRWRGAATTTPAAGVPQDSAPDIYVGSAMASVNGAVVHIMAPVPHQQQQQHGRRTYHSSGVERPVYRGGAPNPGPRHAHANTPVMVGRLASQFNGSHPGPSYGQPSNGSRGPYGYPDNQYAGAGAGAGAGGAPQYRAAVGMDRRAADPAKYSVTCVLPGCKRTGVWVGPKPVPRSGWRCMEHQMVHARCSRFGCNREFMAYPNSRGSYYCEVHFRKYPSRGSGNGGAGDNLTAPYRR